MNARPVQTETRERIVRTAMDLFVAQGYERTGLAQIAKAAGVLPGSLYHFFPSKEDLLRATLETRLKLLWPEVLEPIWSRLDDPLEKVFALLDGYREMLTLTQFQHGCPIGNLALELTESHPKIRALLVQNFENWKQAVSECLRAAASRLPPRVDPETLATFVLTTMEGAVMLGRTYRSLDSFDHSVSCLRDYFEMLVAEVQDWRPPQAPERGSAER